MSDLKKIKEAYWACDDCNTSAGGVFPDGHVCTAVSGECKVCNKEDVTLIPWVDYNWDNPKDDLTAKMVRD